MRRRSVALCVSVLAVAGSGSAIAGPVASHTDRAVSSSCASTDWRQYGNGPDHSFAVSAGCSPITSKNVATLLPKWFFHTKDSVTASPAASR